MGNNGNGEQELTRGWKQADIFAKIVIGIATVLIAGIGGYFTNTYNQRQLDQNKAQIQLNKTEASRLELETVESFFAHLLSTDEKARTAALETIKGLKNQELYTRLNNIFGTDETTANVGKIMASSFVSQIPLPLQQSQIKSVKPVLNIKGWAYLGNFTKEGNWKTRYFTEIKDQKPKDLKTLTLTVSRVTEHLNVRENMPDEFANFFKVIEVLPPDAPVTVVDVKEWASSGFWWAAIDY